MHKRIYGSFNKQVYGVYVFPFLRGCINCTRKLGSFLNSKQLKAPRYHEEPFLFIAF